jgi:hypothetical protein
MPDKVEFEWSSAEVTDGTLVVTLSAKPPKKWRDAFERAAALLSHGDWSVALTQRTAAVTLDPVRRGEEERVRQFLEGALLEANHTILAEDELFEDANGDSQHVEREASADDELTQRFRTFAAR